MPIYEFACTACGARFERLQKMADLDPSECPACAVSGQITRLVSAPQFRLAGSGWYETDFKSDKDKRRNLSGDGGAPSEAAPKAAPADAASTPAPSNENAGSPKAIAAAPTTPAT